MAIEDVVEDAHDRMGKSVEALRRELAIIRTGRASPRLLDSIQVNYYGALTPLNQLATITVPEARVPLNQLATITVPEARVLLIQVWDRGAAADVEKAILASDLGLTPNSDGEVIRITLPVLTEERRRELVKVVARKTEDGHVAVRNIRRASIEGLRKLEKDGEIGQDEGRRAQDQVQKITDSYIGEMDGLRKDKEAEVLEV
jgi:ribosome recycling factor